MKAGAVGYVLKKSGASDLFAAIEAVRHRRSLPQSCHFRDDRGEL